MGVRSVDEADDLIAHFGYAQHTIHCNIFNRTAGH